MLVGNLTAVTRSSSAAATLTDPLPTVPNDIVVRAVTGDAIWASFGNLDERISLDGGQTWQQWDLTLTDSIAKATGGSGWLAYYGGMDGVDAPRAKPVSGNASANPEWSELFTLRALGSRAALATNGALVSSDRTRKVTFPALPKKTSKPSHRYAFTSDSRYLVRLTATAGAHD